jgi:hypothetical protein
MHTLRRYLEENRKSNLAGLLMGATCEFSTDGTFSRVRWDGYATTFRVRLPVERIGKFTPDIKTALLAAASAVLDTSVGYDLMELELSPFLEAPPDEEEPLPGPTWKPERVIQHDGLHFRSKTEIRIYDALKKHAVLFFANAAAVLGGKNIKREPDFVVCLEGKWGILEVMGEQFHPAQTAMRDHDRARLFKDYGIRLIEFYEAGRCYNDSDAVVNDFLTRLSKS